MLIKFNGHYPDETCAICHETMAQDYGRLMEVGPNNVRFVCDNCDVIEFEDGTTAKIDRGIIQGDFDQVNNLIANEKTYAPSMLARHIATCLLFFAFGALAATAFIFSDEQLKANIGGMFGMGAR